jgi:uncharacterized membrane protein
MTQPFSNPTNTSQPKDSVWSFRGYEMRPAEFNTAMVHFYRGEVQRSNLWRQRLDNTTNWAVVTTGAALSFALSDPAHHYGVIILNTLLVTLFLWIEARRYRYYELWSYRVRLMETDFFAAMLVPPFGPHPDWAESLADSLLHPEFPISMWEAFGRRFRRNYMWLYMVLGIAWALKIYLHPDISLSWDQFLKNARLGPLPGEVMLLLGFLYNGLIFLIGLATAGLHQASGEVLPKYGDVPFLSSLWRALEAHDGHETRARPRAQTASQRPARHRQQLLALIISANAQAIADHILKEMKRGVTALHGEGMYTHQNREVLMVAVTVTEMAQLKNLVSVEDPNAFVVVTPAREVLGRGFQPLQEK